MIPVLVIFSRWLHVATACVAVGSIFFMTLIFPIGLRAIDSEPGRTMLLRTRRALKMVIHPCILFLLVSGTYNAVLNWHAYTAIGPGMGHGLFGLHLLFALIIFAIALWLLAGPEPRPNHRTWMRANVVLMFLAIAAASTLKYFREHPPQPAVPVPVVQP